MQLAVRKSHMQRYRSTTALVSLVLSLLLPADALAAVSLQSEDAYIDGVVKKSKDWTAGLSFVGAMKAKVLSFRDYSFDSQLRGIARNKLKTGAARYYFKKKDRVRLEVKSDGLNNGAVVVKQADGKIRGAGGGMLRFVKMNLEPDSRMLQLPNGYNAVQSDLATLLRGIEGKSSGGAEVRLSASSVTDRRWPVPVRVVEVKRQRSVVERIFVNTGTSIPLEWDVYRGGKLISITTFCNFRPNIGLKDQLFEL